MRLDTVLKTKWVRISFGEEVLEVEYRPDAVTPRMVIQVDEAKKPAAQMRAVVEALNRILVSWDLIGEDGKPYPITKESLMDLPLSFLAQVFRAVTEDMSVGKESTGT